LNKEQELINLFKFLLDLDQVEGTNIESRIHQVCKEEDDLLNEIQIPKTKTNRLDTNMNAYTASQI
jgi:hypothetical protein